MNREGQREKPREKKKKIAYFDYNLLFLIIFLLSFGLVMLYSSSAYISANKYGDDAYYLKRQLRNIGLGAVMMFIMAKIDYRIWKKFGTLAYFGSFVLCILVFMPGIGSSSHGSSRWINLGPVSFQPSEVAKLGIIIFLADLIEKVPRQMGDWKTLAKIFAMTIPLLGIVAYSN